MQLRSVLILGLLLTLAACSDNVSVVEDPQETLLSPQSKLRHPHLLDRVAQGAGKTGSPLGLIVALNDDNNDKLEKQKLLERAKLLMRSKLLVRADWDDIYDGLAIKIEGDYEEVFKMLDDDNDVLWYELDLPMTGTPSPLRAQPTSTQKIPWGIAYTGATTSSTKAGNGWGAVKNVAVVVLDTGVKNPDVNTQLSFDVTTMQHTTVDPDGHGTHIAGIIGAYDDADGVVGMAPGVPLYSVRVEDAYGQIDMSSVVMAVEYITEIKRDNPAVPIVVNISLGTEVGTTAYTALDEAIRASTKAGVIYVVSAGNHGSNAATYSPAHTLEAITVGAHDASGRFALFSNYGNVVDLLAPGVDIPSLRPEAQTSTSMAFMSGTSMAAGHVTGAIALALSKYPTLTPADLHAHLGGYTRTGILGAPSGTTTRRLWAGGL